MASMIIYSRQRGAYPLQHRLAEHASKMLVRCRESTSVFHNQLWFKSAANHGRAQTARCKQGKFSGMPPLSFVLGRGHPLPLPHPPRGTTDGGERIANPLPCQPRRVFASDGYPGEGDALTPLILYPPWLKISHRHSAKRRGPAAERSSFSARARGAS